jgi:hypothetical protein
MRCSDLRANFPRVLVTCAAFGLIAMLTPAVGFDFVTGLALAGVALLAHVVMATTIWALDRLNSDDSPRRR